MCHCACAFNPSSLRLATCSNIPVTHRWCCLHTMLRLPSQVDALVAMATTVLNNQQHGKIAEKPIRHHILLHIFPSVKFAASTILPCSVNRMKGSLLSAQAAGPAAAPCCTLLDHLGLTSHNKQQHLAKSCSYSRDAKEQLTACEYKSFSSHHYISQLVQQPTFTIRVHWPTLLTAS